MLLVYTTGVVKPYYVSGFLYHPQSQQVLLQQNSSDSVWEMFSGEDNTMDPKVFFEKTLGKILEDTSGVKHIYPVYSYFNSSLHKTHYIFYAPVSRLKRYHTRSGGALAWFNFKQITKLPLSIQAKHDIVVAGRVIAAQARASEPRVGLEPTT